METNTRLLKCIRCKNELLKSNIPPKNLKNYIKRLEQEIKKETEYVHGVYYATRNIVKPLINNTN